MISVATTHPPLQTHTHAPLSPTPTPNIHMSAGLGRSLHIAYKTLLSM
jgi:hypothetical protein